MNVIPVLVAAIAPGIALLTYFYLKDRYVTEPVGIVLRMFVIGILLVFPTMVVQRGLDLGLQDHDWIQAFVVSAGLEEFLKWFLLFHIIYKHQEFDEPYDGIVYAVALSLGFATMENVLYVWYYPLTPGGIIMRALLPVSGHALFGVVMGYYLGKAKFMPHLEQRYLSFALSFAVLYHGLFNYIQLKSAWAWFIVPLMLLLWIRGMRKVQRANERSPLRHVYTEDGVKL